MQARQRSLDTAEFRPSKARSISDSSLSAGSRAGTVACGAGWQPMGVTPSQPGVPRLPPSHPLWFSRSHLGGQGHSALAQWGGGCLGAPLLHSCGPRSERAIRALPQVLTGPRPTPLNSWLRGPGRRAEDGLFL